MITQRDIYLDCNATHPLLPSVREGLASAILAGESYLSNPASIHRRGQKAKRGVFELKTALCRALGRGESDEFVMTSGATEALNLLLRAFVSERRAAGRRPVLVVSAVEHSAVLDTAAELAGADLVTLGVNEFGQLDAATLVQTLEAILSDDAKDALLILQLANNETGVVFDFDSFLPELHTRFSPKPNFKAHKLKGGKHPQAPQRLFIALDAAQALGKLEPSRIRRAMHAADYVAVSAHKMGGPAGIGALWLRPGVPFKAQITGGSQEKRRRAGTLNSIGAYGFRLALDAWDKHGDAWRAQMLAQRERLFTALNAIEGVRFHGLSAAGAPPELPNTLNFRVDGCLEESLLLALDLDGFCVSSGSACHSGSLRPSHVLLALGVTQADTLSAVRVCLGVETTDVEIDAFIQSVREKVAQIRAARLAAAEWLPELTV